MSSPGDNPQDSSPAPETSPLLPWPVSWPSEDAVLPNDWEHFPHPRELQYLPDGSQTCYELKQIIKRSFYKYEPESSNPQEVKPELQASDAEPAHALTSLSDGPETHRRYSFESADSSKTCSGGSEMPSAATVDAASLVPSPLSISSLKPRELRSKSSFLSSKIERLGAKIEKLEIVSSRRSSRNVEQQKPVTTTECASCLDDLPKTDMTPLSCTHSYCKPCFTTLITTAMQTESLFPPKCCLTEIPLKTVLYTLDNEQRSNYKLKAAEWAQPTEKRWYCPEPQCAKWIAPSKIHRSWMAGLACPHCRTSICRTCRGLAHAPDTHCPQDFGLNAMLDIAEREGWRRCYRCKALVERTGGCRHMTCTCKAEFCYTCGSKWRTCGCTEVDQARREEMLRERRLVADADARREEEEIARAIAEVEAAERREAQEREAAERKREEERLREEEELRRLEELRLAEEEQRKRDEEEAERKRIETTQFSIEERTSSLAKLLTELGQVQQMALISRHETAIQELKTDSERRLTSRQEDYKFQKAKLMTNIERRSTLLKQKHDTKTHTTTSRHEEEEDAMFMQIQIHLRGKPNRETREKSMLETLAQSHKDELTHLTHAQKSEAADLRGLAAMEARGLEHGHRAKVEKIQRTADLKVAHLDRAIAAERHWFEAVTYRRHALLEVLKQDLLRTMGESKLLEEWEALPVPVAGRTTCVSEGRQDLAGHSTQIQDHSLSPVPSPGTAEEIPTPSVTEDRSPGAAPPAKPPKPHLFISTVMTESHTESSQSVWEAQSHLLEQSGTTSTTSRLSVNLQRRGGVKPDKFGRWSFLSGGSKKERMDLEMLKTMLRGTVGDAF